MSSKNLDEYIVLLGHYRSLARLGRKPSKEEAADLDSRKKKLLKTFSPEEKTAAASLDWLAVPRLFDAAENEADKANAPVSERPPMSFRDIPQFPRGNYEIDVAWSEVERQIGNWQGDYKLNLEPDFQREHVWTAQQQSAYCEYQLQGGEIGKLLIFNCHDWNRLSVSSSMEIVDGKQRLEAVRAFLRNEIRVFSRYHREFIDKLSWGNGPNFRWRIVSCDTKADLLRLYLNLNAGGTPHTDTELDRVRKMLQEERG